ncbi:MAG: D-alanyl-D-alanine carboxypeptidase family protein [Ruminococcaceae bacterium]|nr:D-alanyl-D-alanine carboxypeptidase family protein [Oscillospiraceae bacterium]
MGKKATPPRSFNTIRQSQCEKRTKREQKRRFVLLAICAAITLIVLTSLILLVCSIVDAVASNGPGSHNPSDVTYQAFTQEEDGLERGPLMLINKDNKYSFPSNATSVLVDMRDELESSDADIYGFSSATKDYLFNETALEAFNSMMEKYYEVTEDDTLLVDTAYRSKSDSNPGYSDHNSGYCIAFTEAFTNNDAASWITKNCHKYGFIVRYPSEKATLTGVGKPETTYDYEECFRYVGIAHATYIKENDLCLEEYVEMLAEDHEFDGDHLQLTGADGNDYSIYYVPLSDDPVTTLNVPSNFSYTVSGDNREGFIVTVNLSDPIE